MHFQLVNCATKPNQNKGIVQVILGKFSFLKCMVFKKRLKYWFAMTAAMSPNFKIQVIIFKSKPFN